MEIRHFVTCFFTALSLLVSGCQNPTSTKPRVQDNSIWENMRTHFALDDKLNDHFAVEDKINWYLQYPGYLNQILSRSEPFLFYIENEINKRHLPAELALIPFVESEFAPSALSSAGAKGFWQLMPGTATGMNVKINQAFDGRQDIIQSTNAALNYLTYLYNFFDHDWLLAIAAYDAGAGRVLKSLRRDHGLFGLEPSIWELSLPHETQHYLPKILALKAIIQHPEQYNLTLPTITNQPKFCMAKQPHINPTIKEVQQITGLSKKTILSYNTGIKSTNYRPKSQTWIIPIDQCDSFFSKLKSLRHHVPQHIVKKGDTLNKIAKTHHTSLKQLVQINKLNLKKPIHPGQMIKLLPTNLAYPDLHNASNHIHYHCKSNDSLTKIAKKYQIKEKDILFWNHLRPNDKLIKGQLLTLWLPKYSKHKKQ